MFQVPGGSDSIFDKSTYFVIFTLGGILRKRVLDWSGVVRANARLAYTNTTSARGDANSDGQQEQKTSRSSP